MTHRLDDNALHFSWGKFVHIAHFSWGKFFKAMRNEQWVLCFALRQNGYILDNASILFQAA